MDRCLYFGRGPGLLEGGGQYLANQYWMPSTRNESRNSTACESQPFRGLGFGVLRVSGASGFRGLGSCGPLGKLLGVPILVSCLV